MITSSKKLGKEIRKLRTNVKLENPKNPKKPRKMSIESLGKIIDKDKHTISNWEKGESPIPLEMIPPIANALGCSPEHLLGIDIFRHRKPSEIAVDIPLSETAITSLIDLKIKCDEIDEFDIDELDPVNNDCHMKVLLLNTIVEYVLSPVDNAVSGQPTPEELLSLSSRLLENYKIIKQEGGPHAKNPSQRWKDAKEAMTGTEFTIGYRLGRIIGSGLRGWFSKNH